MNDSTAHHDPWSIDAEGYPASDSLEERLRFLLGYAILAPSSRNVQPWLFRIRDGAIELFADRRRSLRVCDPHDRQLMIGCGCALRHLELAFHCLHGEPEVELFPDPEDADLVARIRGAARRAPSADCRTLLEHIPLRRTNRSLFEHREVPEALLADLRAGATGRGVWVEFAGRELKWRIAALVAEADQSQCADRGFRHELADWLCAPSAGRKDGMPISALGIGALENKFGPLVVRTFDVGEGRAARDRQLATLSPVLAVLGTEGDTTGAWLQAGRSLASLMLRATAQGVAVSFFGQPVEIPEMRERLAGLLVQAGSPQVVLRLGYGPAVRPTPRRPVEEVLLG